MLVQELIELGSVSSAPQFFGALDDTKTALQTHRPVPQFPEQFALERRAGKGTVLVNGTGRVNIAGAGQLERRPAVLLVQAQSSRAYNLDFIGHDIHVIEQCAITAEAARQTEIGRIGHQSARA